MKKTPYDILGVPPDATKDDIKKAFRKKAKDCHPDRHAGKEDEFKQLAESYNILIDPAKRRAYDRTGSTEQSSDNLRQESISCAIQSVSSIISKKGDSVFTCDLFAEAIRDVTWDGKQECNKIKEAKKIVRRVVKILSKIKHKNGESSLIYQALATQKNEVIVNIIGMKRRIRVYQNARRVLREYQFEKDVSNDYRTRDFPTPLASVFGSFYTGG